MTSTSIPIRKGGSRNESGFVNNFDKHGMTTSQGLSEIIANSGDAAAEYAVCKIINTTTGKFIKIIDNGFGMNETKFDHMFDAERSNKADVASMGVAGIGGLIG